MIGYKEPSATLIFDAGKKLYVSNDFVGIAILNGLTKLVYIKLMHCTSTK